MRRDDGLAWLYTQLDLTESEKEYCKSKQYKEDVKRALFLESLLKEWPNLR